MAMSEDDSLSDCDEASTTDQNNVPKCRRGRSSDNQMSSPDNLSLKKFRCASDCYDESGGRTSSPQSKRKRSVLPIPDFLIMKAKDPQHKSLFGIVGVQQILPIEKSMSCVWTRILNEESLPQMPPNRKSSYNKLAGLVQEYLGDLKYEEFPEKEADPKKKAKKADAVPIKADAVPIKADADPEKPDADPKKPDADPKKPDADPKKTPGLWYPVGSSALDGESDPKVIVTGRRKSYHTWRGTGSKLRRGYKEGLHNGEGRNVLQLILDKCVKVVKEDLGKKGGAAKASARARARALDNLNFMYTYNIGGGQRDRSSVVYRVLDDRHTDCQTDREVMKHLGVGLEDAKKPKYTGSSRTTPDVNLHSCIEGSARFKFLLIGEVKSAGETHKTTGGEEQTWIQALVGLKELDTTYAVLFDPRKIVLYQIRKESRRLVTRVLNLDLFKPDDLMFDVNNFLLFDCYYHGIFHAQISLGEVGLYKR